MAHGEIPTFPELEAYRMTLALDGVSFVLSFRYMARLDSWYGYLYQIDGTPLHTGLRLAAGVEPFRLLKDARRPDGRFALVPHSDDDKDPGEGELGDRVFLVYFDADDWQRAQDELAAVFARFAPTVLAVT